MKPALLAIALAVAPLASETSAAAQTEVDLNALRKVTGADTEVFEIKNGEAIVARPYLQRIEVTSDATLFTVRNEGTAVLRPNLEVSLVNAYGMRLCRLKVNFETEPIAAGASVTKSVPYSASCLDEIVSSSSVNLPPDWKTVRFASVRNTQGGSPAAEGSLPRQGQSRPAIRGVRPAIRSDQKFGTANIGNITLDARWSNYGAYLQKMIATVQLQWERIIIPQKLRPTAGTSVTVKFVMNDEGRITKILNVETTADEVATRACSSALTDRAPYGTWTEDMKGVLGKQQEMSFTFYYQ